MRGFSSEESLFKKLVEQFEQSQKHQKPPGPLLRIYQYLLDYSFFNSLSTEEESTLVGLLIKELQPQLIKYQHRTALNTCYEKLITIFKKHNSDSSQSYLMQLVGAQHQANAQISGESVSPAPIHVPHPFTTQQAFQEQSESLRTTLQKVHTLIPLKQQSKDKIATLHSLIHLHLFHYAKGNLVDYWESVSKAIALACVGFKQAEQADDNVSQQMFDSLISITFAYAFTRQIHLHYHGYHLELTYDRKPLSSEIKLNTAYLYFTDNMKYAVKNTTGIIKRNTVSEQDVGDAWHPICQVLRDTSQRQPLDEPEQKAFFDAISKDVLIPYHGYFNAPDDSNGFSPLRYHLNNQSTSVCLMQLKKLMLAAEWLLQDARSYLEITTQQDHIICWIIQEARFTYEFIIASAQKYCPQEAALANIVLEKILDLLIVENNREYLLKITEKAPPELIAWKTHRQELQQCRSQLQQHISTTSLSETSYILKKFNQTLAKITETCFNESLSLLYGELKYGFAFLVSGSFSREEASAYSDLEYFFLLEGQTASKEKKHLFECLLHFFSLSIIALGESKLDIEQLYFSPLNKPDGLSENQYFPISKGLRLDEGGNVPFGSRQKSAELFGTVEELLTHFTGNEKHVGDLVLLNNLQSACYLFGSPTGKDISQQFKKKLYEKCLAPISDEAETPTLHSILGKGILKVGAELAEPLLRQHNSETTNRCFQAKPFLNISLFLINGLYLYYLDRIHAISLFDVESIVSYTNANKLTKLKQVGILSTPVAEMLTICLNFFLKLRNEAHLFYQKAKENVYLHSQIHSPDRFYFKTILEEKLFLLLMKKILPQLTYGFFLNNASTLQQKENQYTDFFEAFFLMAEIALQTHDWPAVQHYLTLASKITPQDKRLIDLKERAVQQQALDQQFQNHIKEALRSVSVLAESIPESLQKTAEAVIEGTQKITAKPEKNNKFLSAINVTLSATCQALFNLFTEVNAYVPLTEQTEHRQQLQAQLLQDVHLIDWKITVFSFWKKMEGFSKKSHTFENFWASLSQFCPINVNQPYRTKIEESTAPINWQRCLSLESFKHYEQDYHQNKTNKRQTPEERLHRNLMLLQAWILNWGLYHGLSPNNMNEVISQLKAQHLFDSVVLKEIETLLQQGIEDPGMDPSQTHVTMSQEFDTSQRSVEPLRQEVEDCLSSEAGLRSKKRRAPASLEKPQAQNSAANRGENFFTEITDKIEHTLLKPCYETLPILYTTGAAAFQQAFWVNRLLGFLRNTKSACQVTLINRTQSNEILFIPTEWINAIFNINGCINPTSPDRNSAVFKFGAYCLKILQPEASLKEQEEAAKVFFAREHAFNSLSRLMGFEASPPGCAIKLVLKINRSRQIIYYAWLSRRIEGHHHDLESLQKQHPYASNISYMGYGSLFLLSLLTSPEDGQPANFLVENNSDNQPGKLMSVDNKRIFVRPTYMTDGGWFSVKEEKLNLKTYLYFLSAIKTPFDTATLLQCQTLNIKALTNAWLETMNIFDSSLHDCLAFPQKNKERESHNFKCIQLDRMLIVLIPLKLQQILRLLSSHKNIPTYEELLKKIEPKIAQRYEHLKKYSLPYYTIFKEHYRTNSYGEWFSAATSQFIQDSKLQHQQLGAMLLESYPKFAMEIQWSSSELKDNYEKQFDLLQILLQGKQLPEINLSGCIMVKNKELKRLLENSPNLKYLNISHCPHLTANIFSFISDYCKQLEILICDGNFWIEELRWRPNLPVLKMLSFQNCQQLRCVYIDGPTKLKYVSILHTKAAVSNNKRYAAEFNKLGNRAFAEGNYSVAVDNYSEAVTVDSKNPDYFYNRGTARKHLGELTNALMDYNAAIYLNSSQGFHFKGRGLIKQQQGDIAGAIKDYDEALSHIPFDHITQHYKAMAYLMQQENGFSTSIFDSILSKKMTRETDCRAQRYAAIGLCLIDWYNPNKENLLISDIFYSTYETLTQRHSRVYLCCDILASWFVQTLKNASFQKPKHLLGMAFTKVWNILLKVIQDYPNEPEPYYWLAELALLAREVNKAKKWLLTCLQLSPGHEYAQARLKECTNVSTNSFMSFEITEKKPLSQLNIKPYSFFFYSHFFGSNNPLFSNGLFTYIISHVENDFDGNPLPCVSQEWKEELEQGAVHSPRWRG